MTDKPQIRMSALNAIAACPASWREEQSKGNIGSTAAREGTLEHRIATAIATADEVPRERWATEFDTDTERIAYIEGRLAWLADASRLGWSVDSEREVVLEVEGILLRGHPDLVCIAPDRSEAELADFKTGRVDVPPIEQNYQLKAYALGVIVNERVPRVTARIIYTRTMRIETATWTAQSLTWDLTALVAEATAANPEYRPFCEHCQYCAARAHCPALNPAIPLAFSDTPTAKPFGELSPATQARAVLAARTIKSMAEDVLERAKAHVDAHGPIDVGGGRMFAKIEESHDEIDTAAAWGVATEHCGTRLPEAIKLSKSGLIKAAQAFYEDEGAEKDRGWKTAVEKELMSDLWAAEAVSKKTVYKYQVVNKPQENGGKIE